MASIQFILKILCRKALEMCTYENLISIMALNIVSPTILYAPYADAGLTFLRVMGIWVFNGTFM